MAFIKLTDLDLAGKRVLIRADLNVPVKDGKVTSDARIAASMPTVEHCVKAGAKVQVMSHRGRPEEGKVDEENSMQPIAEDMSAKLGTEVRLIKDYLDNAPAVADGEGQPDQRPRSLRAVRGRLAARAAAERAVPVKEQHHPPWSAERVRGFGGVCAKTAQLELDPQPHRRAWRWIRCSWRFCARPRAEPRRGPGLCQGSAGRGVANDVWG